MKSPGIVYRRYRQLKKKYLYEKIIEAREKRHTNCFYGKTVLAINPDGTATPVNLCLLEAHRGNYEAIDVCSNPRECNAFVNKMCKDSAVSAFEDILSDNEQKAKQYPEIALLEWVLDKDLNDALKEPNWIGKIALKVIVILESIIKTFGKSHKNTAQPVSINN